LYLEEGSFLDSASTPDSESRITLLFPLLTRQSDSGVDFVVVAVGGKGGREVGVMDMELSVLLVVLSSMQLPSIFFFLLVVVVVVVKEGGAREKEKERGRDEVFLLTKERGMNWVV
jgi:hypothetical protein